MSFHFLDDINFDVFRFFIILFFRPAFKAKIFWVGRFLIRYVCKPYDSAYQPALKAAWSVTSRKVFIDHSDCHVVGIDLFFGCFFILFRWRLEISLWLNPLIVVFTESISFERIIAIVIERKVDNAMLFKELMYSHNCINIASQYSST